MRHVLRSQPGWLSITLVAAFAWTLHAPAPAGAAPLTTARMDAYLAGHPGGVPVNANEIAYAGGAFIVTLTGPATPAGVQGVPDCPSGSYCFYEWGNFGYPRGRLSDCGTQDLGTWYWRNRTESVQNKTGATVQFFNGSIGSGQLLFTVYPGYTMSMWPPTRTARTMSA